VTQTLEEKAEAILVEGRLRVRAITSRAVIATCISTDDETVYWLGYDAKRKQWRCGCPVPGRRACSHLAALQLVVDESAVGRSDVTTTTTTGGQDGEDPG
jgi:hypothetical protein